MSAALQVDRRLKREWRLQVIPRRYSPNWIAARKGRVAMCIEDLAKRRRPYAELEQLRIKLMYEDEFRGADEAIAHREPLRFCGYRASRIPHGVLWSGAENAVFFKDLTRASLLGTRPADGAQ